MKKIILLAICTLNVFSSAYAGEANIKDKRAIFHQFMEIAFPKNQAEQSLALLNADSYSKHMTEFIEKLAMNPLNKTELNAVRLFFFQEYMNEFPYEKQVDIIYDGNSVDFDTEGMEKVIAFATTSDGKNILKLIHVAQNNGHALPFKLLDQNFDAIKIETSEKEFKKVFPHIQLKE